MAELRAEQVSVRYGRATALHNVDLVAPAGRVTAVVGPNGAGKSSLVLAIYGSAPATGRVLFDGVDLSGMRAAARARSGVALVPQGRQLFPRLTVRENLLVLAEALRLPPREVDAALDRFPILRERARSLVGVLSGGEQQMLVVSRALMGSPRLLLLDEMTTGLAPLVVAQLADTIVSLTRQGVVVVLAEPSISPVVSIVDRGYVLIRGQVVATEEQGGQRLSEAYQAAMGIEQKEALGG